MLRLRQAHPIAPEVVETIECDLRPYPLVRQDPTRGHEGRFSMPFCLAMALARGRLDPEDFTDRNLADPTVQLLISRTRHMPGATVLTVVLRDGTRRAEDLRPHSDLTDPGQIKAKFQRATRGILGETNASTLVEMIETLNRLASARQLAELLRTGLG
jgi:2-methylcitrate dehydratase PrpD